METLSCHSNQTEELFFMKKKKHTHTQICKGLYDEYFNQVSDS